MTPLRDLLLLLAGIALIWAGTRAPKAEPPHPDAGYAVTNSVIAKAWEFPAMRSSVCGATDGGQVWCCGGLECSGSECRLARCAPGRATFSGADGGIGVGLVAEER